MDYAAEVAHRATLTLGTRVRLVDDDPNDAGAIARGTVVEPTAAEKSEPAANDAEVAVVVQWTPGYRRWEYAEDLRVI